jgi:hypothetical protein
VPAVAPLAATGASQLGLRHFVGPMRLRRGGSLRAAVPTRQARPPRALLPPRRSGSFVAPGQAPPAPLHADPSVPSGRPPAPASPRAAQSGPPRLYAPSGTTGGPGRRCRAEQQRCASGHAARNSDAKPAQGSEKPRPDDGEASFPETHTAVTQLRQIPRHRRVHQHFPLGIPSEQNKTLANTACKRSTPPHAHH